MVSFALKFEKIVESDWMDGITNTVEALLSCLRNLDTVQLTSMSLETVFVNTN